MTKHKPLKRVLSLLLSFAAVFSIFSSIPASAYTLNTSASVTISSSGRHEYLYKSSGGSLGGSNWDYTSNDGIKGAAYCVNWGLGAVSPSKALTLQPYNRNPQTMGAFANGYPMRTLEQFKQLHESDVRGVSSLTEDEYRYATQIAVWATCGQLSVPGTAFTSGRAALIEPASDAQQIRIYDSIKAILGLSAHWTKHIYNGMYVRAEENEDIRAVEVVSENGLEGAAATGAEGIKKETIGGEEYYTRVMYVACATSTWIDGYTTRIYSTDAPNGTTFVAVNNSPLEVVRESGVTYYKVDTSTVRSTSLNANGEEYYGAFKVCIPVDNVTDSGSFNISATGNCAQFNLFLANNPNYTEQSYIVSDPGYTTCGASAEFKWSSSEDVDDTASLQVLKAGPGGSPLEGAKFTLTGSGGTTVTGTSDRNGQIIWRDLPANESYTLTETAAPDGYQIVAPMNISLTAGHTSYVTVKDDDERSLKVYKIDAQNKASLQGAVFLFVQIDGSYKTTGTTGFDGLIEFAGDGLPYGSYRITEQSAPEGYVKDTHVETVEWDGTRDVTLTFENVRETGLTVVKKDADTGVSLPGATFDVYADGEKITSVTTNDAGEAYVTGIKKEAYIEVVETAAPNGYVIDQTPHGIHIDPYDPAIEDDPVLTVVNHSKASLRIIKYDQTSGKRLPGVTFEIYKDTELFDTKTTDDNGEILLYELEPGTYLVKEVSTDDSHVVNSTPQQIELKAGQTATQELVFFNSLKPGIHLVKVDSVTMKSLPNVRFEFKLVGGSYKQEFTTDINGEIDLSKLTPGAYEVRELEAPDGYLMDDSVRVVQINPDENANFVFTNTPKPSLKLIKLSSDGSRLAGVSFRIAKIEDGSHYLDRITDDKGEINIADLEPGVYSVQETATVADHIIDVRVYHVELFAGKTSTITIENQRRPNLVVYKHDADTNEPVPDTVFLVKAADGHSLDEIKTDKDGKATLSNLLPGVYEISEKSVPSAYLLDAPSQLVTLYANRDHTVYFENHKKPTLTINKVDSVTGSPIQGAKFQVWYGSNSTSTGELNSLGTYFSDANGQIVLDKLRDGWYKVTELEPAAGFTIKQPATQEFYIKGGENKTVTFENTPLNAIVVEKYDSVTGEALPGCTFQLRYLGGTSGTGGTVIGTKVTGKNGTAIWTGLKPGAYVLEEVDAADGYSIIQSSETVMLADSGDQSVVTVRFTNSPDGNLLIRKVCSVNPSVTLQNAEFKVVYADGSVIGDSNGVYRTDENGEIRISGLKPGKSVVVTETKAPDGFIIDTQSQTIQIQEGKTVSLTFKNQPKGAIIIQKRDSSTGQSLSGAEFRVTTAAGCEVGLDGVIGTSTLTQNGIFTTDSNGEIRITNLAPGAYVLTETKAPAGYVMDAPSTNVVIGANGDTQTVVITNTPKGGLIVEKYDSVTKLPLSGAQFKITNANGELTPDNEGMTSSNGLYTTDANGQIVLSKLLPGTYVVTETRAPDNYQLDPTPQTVVVNAADTQTLRFYDEPLCTLTVLKRDAVTKKPLKGAEFTVKDSDGRDIGKYVTGTDGTATVSGLAPNGTYVVSESKAPTGYVRDETPKNIVVRSGVANSLTFDDEPATTLIIHKYVEGTENEPLSGVCFKVVDGSGAAVGPDDGIYYTDKAGEIVIDGLEPGTTVTAREIKTVEGYVLDGTPQDILIKAGEVQQLTFWNKKAGTLVIQKKDSVSGALISGAQFQLTYANGGYVDNDNGHLSSNGLYTTDDKGEIRISGITGTVVVKEVKAASGYVIDQSTQTQTVTVNAMDTQTLTFLNDPLCSLTLTKLDSKTGKPVPGTVFAVKDGNGNVLGSYTTGKDGTATVTGLVPGSTVVVTETKVPDGYVLDSMPQTIIVKNGSNAVSSGVGNTGSSGGTNAGGNTNAGTGGGNNLTFENDPIGGVEIIKVNEDDKSQRIPDTVFEIRKMDGGLVDTVTTDENGRVYTELDAGDYYAVELKAAEGFRLNVTPHYFTVENGKTTTLTITNKAFSGILIHKIDANTREGICGAVFLLYDSNKIPIGQYTSDDRGYVCIDDLYESGRYYLRELENEGYIVDDQLKSVNVTSGKTTEITWKNTPITGQIQITKTSADYNSMNGWPAGTPIPGTVFEIYHYRTGRLVDTVKTDRNGIAVSSPLPLGRYKIVESQAAEFYGLDTTPIEVEIEYAGQIVKAAMTDKSLSTNVSITKTGYTEVMPGQLIRYDFSGIGNNSTTALTSFYWRDTLPVNAVRLDKIVTGTYNVQGNYKIVYKTNLSGGSYRTLADNLSTQQNYALNASPVALGLASNEYVTEFMVSFGVVPPNFRQVQAPQVYCTVLPNLVGGAQFVNTADVGGVYNGQWIMAVSRWVTTVYKPAKTTSSTLPRTGY
ncbi:MAG: SpaA isopeptide-forming pilin-related protein [Butyricicoccus sp.]|nr:SpaA isopeptide-forming pilin-related protein [Butyricicoccus sp.]